MFLSGIKTNWYLIIFPCTFRQGDFIGLSGKSGKGKTTIINLLLGFLEADSGCVYMNNVPTTSCNAPAILEKYFLCEATAANDQ